MTELSDFFERLETGMSSCNIVAIRKQRQQTVHDLITNPSESTLAKFQDSWRFPEDILQRALSQQSLVYRQALDRFFVKKIVPLVGPTSRTVRI